MDDTVKQAMLKWPNVPACHGWLALDARGRWRMRDAQTQAAQLAGDVITHPALLDFINRNYLVDQVGCWYFQNGPQQVYVDLAVTPFIARTDPSHGLILHTGEMLSAPSAVWVTEIGNLVFQSGSRIAQLDDRDLSQCLGFIRRDGDRVTDDDLLAWLSKTGEVDSSAIAMDRLNWHFNDQIFPLLPIKQDALAERFRFICKPLPAAEKNK